MESVSGLKNRLKSLRYDELPHALKLIGDDDRKGVESLVQSLKNKYENYIKECERLETLNFYENFYYKNGYKNIGGIDEVGRGPLAGPVVACCVVLPPNTKILHINDSKKLSEAKRNELYLQISYVALAIGISTVSNRVIDNSNISSANYTAMSKAASSIGVRPDVLLVDGYKIPERYTYIQQEAIIKGDSKSISIAAASIIAKVTRDEIMCKYHEKYPMYGFNLNKGYGTKNHIQAIKEYGPCPIHRLSFIKNFI